jgi:site-specific DNA-methyltransferase (adenine-specific)
MPRLPRTVARPDLAAPPIAQFLDQVHEEDCIAGMRKLPAYSVDLVIADPPYNRGVAYDDHDDKMSDLDFLQWCADWLEQIARVLKQSGSFWLFVPEEYVAELQIIAEAKYGLMYAAPGETPTALVRDSNRLALYRHVIWYFTFGQNATRKLTRSHIHLLHFVRDPRKTKINIDEVRVPSARQLVYNDKRADPSGRLPDATWILRPADAPADAFANDHDVIYVPRLCGTFKAKRNTPNQIPEQLISRIIRFCSDPPTCAACGAVVRYRNENTLLQSVPSSLPDVRVPRRNQQVLLEGVRERGAGEAEREMRTMRGADPLHQEQLPQSILRSRVRLTVDDDKQETTDVHESAKGPSRNLPRVRPAVSSSPPTDKVCQGCGADLRAPGATRHDVVLDPFCGSGTSAAVARKLDRKFITYDISASYILQSRIRLDGLQPGAPLDPIGEWK